MKLIADRSRSEVHYDLMDDDEKLLYLVVHRDQDRWTFYYRTLYSYGSFHETLSALHEMFGDFELITKYTY